ncbi:uncharacterized protein [Anoplolepis gracilipes]|uniref:uncharacterized protein n=1 Tax=Anoplolepis gracilipes TaxID=354296 RepID=UPI003BA11ED1
MRCDKTNVHTALQQMLIQYRNMSHSTTGKSPAELLFTRRLRTRLNFLHPEIKKNYETNEANITFKEGERISARDYLDDGRIWKRHVNQMRHIGDKTPAKLKNTTTNDSLIDTAPIEEIAKDNATNANHRAEAAEIQPPPQALPLQPENDIFGNVADPIEIEPQRSPRPQRPRKLPIRFKDFERRGCYVC